MSSFIYSRARVSYVSIVVGLTYTIFRFRHPKIESNEYYAVNLKLEYNNTTWILRTNNG